MLSVLVAVLLILAVSALPSPGHRVGTSFGTPGIFDYYVFVRFWMPEACNAEYDDCCKAMKSSDWAASNLALHGLWPNYDIEHSGNGYPSDCWESNSTYWNHVSNLESSVTDQFSSQWTKYAPEYMFGLDTHEWQTHGTCYSSELIDVAEDQQALNAAQARYFQGQMDLCGNFTTPSLFQTASESGEPVDIATLQNAFGGSSKALLACDEKDGKYYLNSVGLCISRDDFGNPVAQIDCTSVAQDNSYVNSCVMSKASEVYILKFGQEL